MTYMLDMLIAAHARTERIILVTNNVREFECVPDLELENWAEQRMLRRSSFEIYGIFGFGILVRTFVITEQIRMILSI